MRLDARLSLLCELAAPCGILADIGADHGRLSAHMLLTGGAKRALLCDISAASLQKARLLFEKLPESVRARAEFCVGDGLAALPEGAKPDALVIAGMGGGAIARILEAGAERLAAPALILQPNVAHPALREALARLGYRITEERIANAEGRWYVAIKALPDKEGGVCYSRMELTVGPMLLKKGDPKLIGYCRHKLRVLAKARRGALGSGGVSAPQVARIDLEIAYFRQLARAHLHSRRGALQ